MIANERELAVTRSKLAKLKEARQLSTARKNAVRPELHQAMLDGFHSLIAELENEIAEYQELKEKPFEFKGSLEELPSALIKARIAKSLTQEELASVLHIKSQQIQRYEKSSYRGVSFHRLIEIAKSLHLQIETEVKASKKNR